MAAKEAALAPLTSRGGPELRQDSGLLDPWAQIGAIPASAIARIRHVDPLPYGLQGQSAVLEALGTCLLELGLVTTPVEVMKLFAPSTRDL
jgi:hypothetical protein